MPTFLKIIFIITAATIVFVLIGNSLNFLKEQHLKSLGIDYDKIKPLTENQEALEFPLSPEMQDFSERIDYNTILNSRDRINEILKEKGFSNYFSEDEEGGSYAEFISPDGKLKMQYPERWLKTPGRDLEELSNSQKSYNTKTIFLAQSLDIEKIAQVIISERIYEENVLLDQVAEDMQEINKDQGWDMQIGIKEQLDEGDVVFEAKYLKEARYSLYSKERIISSATEEGQQKVYTVAFISLDKYWDAMRDKADFMIASVQLIANNNSKEK